MISNVNSIKNEFEGVLALLSELAESYFLVVDEGIEVVELLDDVSEQVVANHIDLAVNLSFTLLEYLDLGVD